MKSFLSVQQDGKEGSAYSEQTGRSFIFLAVGGYALFQFAGKLAQPLVHCLEVLERCVAAKCFAAGDRLWQLPLLHLANIPAESASDPRNMKCRWQRRLSNRMDI